MKKDPKIIKVKKDDRISCPTMFHENWNLHPRVSINLEGKKSTTCYYCGTVFKSIK